MSVFLKKLEIDVLLGNVVSVKQNSIWVLSISYKSLLSVMTFVFSISSLVYLHV